MKAKPQIMEHDRSFTVRVPISIRRRGGRKLVLAPDGSNVKAAPVARRIDSAMVKAIARAFRWREMLENGTHPTIAEIAAVEQINPSYISRVMRSTLLSPHLIQAILDGQQTSQLTLPKLMKPFPVTWREQAQHFAADRAPEQSPSAVRNRTALRTE
jgi:hypothetical protein